MVRLSEKDLRWQVPSQLAPQRGRSTVMDWKGNSSRPEGTSRRHRLHCTTNVLRLDGDVNMESLQEKGKR
jgi:hypothetical protein